MRFQGAVETVQLTSSDTMGANGNLREVAGAEMDSWVVEVIFVETSESDMMKMIWFVVARDNIR